MSKQGVVNIHGKEYRTVILRLNEFRQKYPIDDGWGIQTKILYHDEESVLVQAFITSPNGTIVGNGLAEEKRNASTINRTSAVEVCETSAIGRALASIGLGGEEYASADEVLNAIRQQDDEPKKSAQVVSINEDVDRRTKMVQEFMKLQERGVKQLGLEKYTSIVNFILEQGYGGKDWKEQDIDLDTARKMYNDISNAIDKNGGS